MKTVIRVYACCLLVLFACGNKIIAHSAVKKRTIKVSGSTDLKAALADAKPGDNIILADGIYEGNFEIKEQANGTANDSVMLIGSRKAILDGGTTNTGYVLHLQASYWHLKGFTIRNGLKGLMTDNASHNTIDSISIHHIGEEGLHFRTFSSDNVLQYADISNTGLKTADYGEGVYIGSAEKNWKKYTNGVADRCDSNLIFQNSIGPQCTAECIDVKEGTTANIIRNNHFDATGITGANSADSWMDVKGNNTIIENNEGYNPEGSVLADGFQVHCAAEGWGNDNVFISNKCTVNAPGYGINISPKSSKGEASGNKVFSNNKVINAAKGVANIPLNQ